MIKVGIIDADSPKSGELIRILVNHPEAELTSLVSPLNNGRIVSSIHHGLIGENPMIFSDSFNPEEIDVLFITEDSTLANEVLDSNLEDRIKIIDLTNKNLKANLSADYEIGLSEINRKALVRSAHKASVPSVEINAPLIALFPLAKYLLLNSEINIDIKIPEDLFNELNERESSDLIKLALQSIQTSFSNEINLNKEINKGEDRIAEAEIILDNNLSLEELNKIIEELYDDHNFTFFTTNNIGGEEVEGTQKVVVQVSKPSEDKLKIKILADARMRGGSGDAIHIMNLFFKLHEKTGLTLKSSSFYKKMN